MTFLVSDICVLPLVLEPLRPQEGYRWGEHFFLPSVGTGRGGVVNKPGENGVVQRVPDGKNHVACVEMAVLNLPQNGA